jgi:hypothetical protein
LLKTDVIKNKKNLDGRYIAEAFAHNNTKIIEAIADNTSKETRNVFISDMTEKLSSDKSLTDEVRNDMISVLNKRLRLEEAPKRSIMQSFSKAAFKAIGIKTDNEKTIAKMEEHFKEYHSSFSGKSVTHVPFSGGGGHTH